jgi:tetratricopeptide (TPR) repeat protein
LVSVDASTCVAGECERALRHAIVCEERLEEAAREKALQALQSDVAAPPSLQPVPDADSSEISAATLGSPQRERKVLDDTSVESAVSYNDVALVYYEQGEPAVALRLFAKALKIFEAAADDTSKAVQKNAGVDSGDGDVSARQIADSYYNMAIACAELHRVITVGGVDDDAARAEEQQELLAAVIASLAASGSEDAADMSAWGGAGPAALAATAAALCYRRAASVYRGALGAHAEETVEAVRGAQWAEAAALDAATTRA